MQLATPILNCDFWIVTEQRARYSNNVLVSFTQESTYHDCKETARAYIQEQLEAAQDNGFELGDFNLSRKYNAFLDCSKLEQLEFSDGLETIPLFKWH